MFSGELLLWPIMIFWLAISIQTLCTVSLPFMSGLGRIDEDKLLATRIMTPVSFPQGPITDLGGQKALKSSMLVVAAME